MDESAPSPPLIDISALRRDPDGAEAAATAAEIHGACLDWGFFVVVGHGLDAAMEAVFTQARAFFAQAPAFKETTPRVGEFGFVPLASEAVDTSRASTRTEFLDLGLADEVAFPDLAGFDEAVRTYQGAALGVAARLLQAIAAGVGAGPTFFADRMVRPRCKLRLMHYPAVDPGPDAVLPVPTTPHTDYGALTLLATDGVPGLEIRPRGRTWTPVTAPSGSLVVNLGDLLARWTNDLYRSTPHRVVGPPSGDRISIPFFVNPDPGTVVTCIPACVTDDRPAAYGPVTAGEFLTRRRIDPHEPYVDPGEGADRRVERIDQR